MYRRVFTIPAPARATQTNDCVLFVCAHCKQITITWPNPATRMSHVVPNASKRRRRHARTEVKTFEGHKYHPCVYVCVLSLFLVVCYQMRLLIYYRTPAIYVRTRVTAIHQLRMRAYLRCHVKLLTRSVNRWRCARKG